MAEFRAGKGSEVARRLFDAAEAKGSRRARNRAVLIGRCNDPENLWTAERLQNDSGDFYTGTGNLSTCGSRLCPSCMAVMRRRTRKQLEKAIASYKPKPDARARFVTLTGPKLLGVPLLDTVNIFIEAYALLTDRVFWKERVDASARGIEFTAKGDGYHTHAHALV